MPVTTSGLEAPPRNDAYVGLLVVSLLALILGCVLLVLDWSEYGELKAPLVPPDTGRPAEAAPLAQ